MGSAALWGAAMSVVQAKPEKPRLRVAVASRSSFNQLPFTIAVQLGFFRAEGLELELVEPADAQGGPMPDVYSGAYTHTIRMQGQNQSYRAFALQGRGPLVAFGVATKALPGFRHPSELRGKRIGVLSQGALTSVLARMVLARAGLAPAEASLVGLESPQAAMAALRSGQIDALSHCDPVMSQLEQRGEIKVISDARTLKGAQQVFGGTMPAACLYASQEFVKASPATCQALANGLVRALKWLQTAGPSDLIRSVPEPYLMGDRGVYLATFEKARESFSVDGTLSEEAARTAWKAMAETDAVLRFSRIELERTYTNEFVQRAKTRFRV